MYKIHLKFAIFGASGSGKSTILRLLQKISPNVSIHRKDSTRPPRKTEPKEGTIELRFVKILNNEEYDIIYPLYGHLYGVRKNLLMKAFDKKEIHFIVINNISAIQQFKYMYPDAKAIYIHTDPEKIPENYQKREGIELVERKRRILQQYHEFLENNTLFDHVVLNFWDLENSTKQLKNIIHYYMRKATGNL